MAPMSLLIGITDEVNSLFKGASYYTISAASGILAAAAAYVANMLARRLSKVADALVVPLVEELLKSALALLLGASIPLTHLVFGLVEGASELRHVKRGKIAALLGAVSHLSFGLITAAVYRLSGSAPAGVAGAVLAHMVWNAYVYDLVRT